GDAGFEILRFAEPYRGDESAEPGSPEHLAAYLPPFFTLLARRSPRGARDTGDAGASGRSPAAPGIHP
ncbi:MAG: hypothetical protein M3O15_09000, partial [Acidobacteriota bacterium]|nr:hypothetical protein [Acidobacteriota bacterium]